jgi:hypothetical protein
MQFRDGSNKGTASNLGQISEKCNGDPAMNRQAFGGESMSRTRVLNGMLGSGQTKKGETGEGQSQEHAHHFFDIKEDCSQRICPGRPTGCVSRLRTVSRFLFHQGIFH